MPEIVVASVAWLIRQEPRAIGVEGDLGPVRVGETVCGRGELFGSLVASES
jgi:hypothetical protein